MAKDSFTPLTPLTRSRVALLIDLTRAITAAVLQDDLERASGLLDQRQIVLKHLDWAHPAEDLENDLEDLRNLDQSLVSFCRTWLAALEERLQSLTLGQRLRQQYAPPSYEARFIDMRK